MPSQRTSPNSARHSDASSSPRFFAVPSQVEPDAYRHRLEFLTDANTKLNTALNKSNEERDHYMHLYEQAKKRLEDRPASAVVHELQAMLATARKTCQGLQDKLTAVEEAKKTQKEELEELRVAYEVSVDDHAQDRILLKDQIESLEHKLKSSPNSARTSQLPERPKHNGASKEHRHHGRTKDREHEKQKKKENEAQKERLHARLDGPRESRPPTSNSSRRSNYYTDAAPSARRSSSSRPHSRHPPSNAGNYSLSSAHIPRTTNLGSPSAVYGYHSSGSSAVMDEEYEDGNYHPHPV